MAKPPSNHGKTWTNGDIKELKRLNDQNTLTPLMAYRLGRKEDSVRSKAQDLDLSLKPVNKSPYNRQKGK